MSLLCHELGCRRGARTLFAGLDFELRPGEVLRIRGDNGSGKTSLLRILAGLRQPDAGRVLWQGSDIHAGTARLRQDLLYIGHAAGVKDCLSVAENLVHQELSTGKADVLAALEKVGLASQAQALVKTLSQGQRRRVALARLHLPRRRPIWILDEPFVGLDAGAVASLCDTMQAQRAGGGIVLYTTHQDAGPPDVRHLRLGDARAC